MKKINQISPMRLRICKTFRTVIITLLSFVFLNSGLSTAQTSQPTVIPAGSFIINMGVVPQTVANGLKPYGLIYALLQIKCPVDWVINQSKTKDGTDFTYSGVAYKGGPFIIRTLYRTAAVNALITTWQSYGVVGITTTSPVTVPVYCTFWNLPKWTLDKQNGSIAVKFFNYAGIPSTAYGGSSSNYWKLPSQLTCCDDIFVMPHADPTWATHRHLYEWMAVSGDGIASGCKGGVWLGCHAGSALMNMFDNITTDGDPIDNTQQTNLLVGKTGPAAGAGPWSDPGNSILLWGDHDDGTPPYSYDYSGESVMQFMGTIDAAQQNGSEQIYIPVGGAAGWNTNTHVGVYDPDHTQRYNLSNDKKYRAAVLAYGPGFGIEGNGKIMLEAAHNISGTGTANVAAQRAFFNYCLQVMWEKAVLPDLTGLPDTIYSGNSYNMGYNLYFNTPGGSYTLQSIQWSAGCGGTWNTSTSNPTTFIAPTVASPQPCNISVTITDACGRQTFDTHQAILAPCSLQSTKTVTPVSCNGGSDGSISITCAAWASPYNWTWSRTNPAGGPVSGTGTSITGLSTGTYSVTISNTSPSCTGTISAVITQPAPLTTSTSLTNPPCNGGNGSINLSVSGGTAPYTFLWSNAATTEDLSTIPAGTYYVTVTDTKNCTVLDTAVLTQPTAGLTVTGTANNVSCYGGTTGTINITVSGGTVPYTYDWGGGITTEDRNGLTAGSYNVMVTDANGCKGNASFTITQPTAMNLSVSVINPTCADINPPIYSIYDGMIDLTVSNGTSPYTYAWTGPAGFTAATQDITALAPGTYNVTVSDANGCTATISAIVLVATTGLPPQPTIINH